MKISRCELAAHPPTTWVSSLLFDMKRWPSDAVSVSLMQNGVDSGTKRYKDSIRAQVRECQQELPSTIRD